MAPPTGRPLKGHEPVSLNLIAVRGYFPSDIDLENARPPFSRHGDVQCTQTFAGAAFGEKEKPPRFADSLLVCFRAEQTLTVTVMSMGRVSTDRSVAAVNEAWELQR